MAGQQLCLQHRIGVEDVVVDLDAEFSNARQMSGAM
jgi:hypothetical protein